MNNRDYKLHYPGGFFHAYNRGNARETIFCDADDHDFFLRKVRQNIFPQEVKNRFFRPIPEGSFSIVAYCLMPNHFHLLIRQNGEIPIGKLIGKICTSYSMYFNKKYGRVGQVFQDQYKQVHVRDDRYLSWLSAYIHQNPTVAKMVQHPKRYPWSSYGEYEAIHTSASGICDKQLVQELFPDMGAHLQMTADAGEIMKRVAEEPDVFLDTQI